MTERGFSSQTSLITEAHAIFSSICLLALSVEAPSYPGVGDSRHESVLPFS